MIYLPAHGGPIMAGGVHVAVVVDRFLCGEKVEDLAEDYDKKVEDIEECLRYWITRRRKRPIGVKD